MTDAAIHSDPLPVGSLGRRAGGWYGMLAVIMTEGALFAYLLFSYYYFAVQYGREFLPPELPKFLLRHNGEGKVEWAPVGGGEFDNLAHIRALLKDGYKETFTLETHWRDPKGKKYSTETSLAALLKVIEKV